MSDLRLALRRAARRPAFSLIVIVTLALGIGGSASMYTALERVVLDPLPYPDAARLVRLKSAVPGVGPGAEWDVSEGAWFYFDAEATALDALGAYRRSGATALEADRAERVQTAVVSVSLLPLLGARAAVGRVFANGEDRPGAAPVAVLSDAYWERRYARDPDILGRVVVVDEVPHEIVGVMAAGVTLPPEAGVPAELTGTDLWLPLTMNPAGPFWNAHTRFRTLARLAPGRSLDEAQAELDRLTARLPDAVPNAYSDEFMARYGFATLVYPLKSYVVGEIAESLWILFAAVGLVMLIAWANVANLLLVRAEDRRAELVVRGALGASPATLARTFLADGLLFGGVGGALALVLTFWGVDWLASLAPEGIPRLAGLRPDGSVVAVTAGLSLLTAIAVALAPAIRATRMLRRGELLDGGRRHTTGRHPRHVRSGLVVTQVALALVLLVGAGLLGESFRRLLTLDPGFQPDGVLTARLHLPGVRYEHVPDMWRFYDAALTRIRALPGVSGAGLTGSLPLDGGFGCTIQGFEDPGVYERLGESGETLCAGQELTSPGYVEAMGIPVLRGRSLTQADHDHPERGSVVVSRAFAERFWPEEDPIGKGVGPSGRTNQQFYRVVGVVGDVYANSPAGEPAIAIYYPIIRIPGTSGSWPNPSTLVVKTTVADPTTLLPAIRGAIGEVDPAIPLADVVTMETIAEQSRARVSFMMTLIALAASIALLLAAVGLYGVVSYTVSQRTSEIGIRMALGAQPADVARLVVTGSVRLALTGIVIGAGVTVGASRALQAFLYGVESTDPLAYLAAGVVLGGVAALAAYLPARRAVRTDPMEALRHE